MSKHHWTCPYCQRNATIGADDIKNITHPINDFEGYTSVRLFGQQIVCPNPTCKKQTLVIKVQQYKYSHVSGTYDHLSFLNEFTLLPKSFAKPQPDYIPLSIRQDYEEACAIRDLSPKASATLARRCLQGIIRDFYGISKSTLAEEIKALKDKIDDDIWNAIDAIRKIGKFGAHPEKDINTIIDVEAGEAQTMIELLELLFEEWYINRYNKSQRLLKVASVAASKKEDG